MRQLIVHRPDAPTIPHKKNERNTVAGRLRYTIDINVVFTRPTLALGSRRERMNLQTRIRDTTRPQAVGTG